MNWQNCEKCLSKGKVSLFFDFILEGILDLCEKVEIFINNCKL